MKIDNNKTVKEKEIINRFLDEEVLLSPQAYEKIKNISKENLETLIKKISEFKKYNDSFILLDEKFLDVFLNSNLNTIIKDYKNFDFIEYYTGEKTSYEEKQEEKIEDKDKKKEEKNKESEFLTYPLDHKKEQFVKRSEEDLEEKLKNLLEKEKDKSNTDIENERKKRYIEISKIRESVNNKINWVAKDIEERIKIYDDSDVSGKSTCTGTIEDFVKYFKDRFERLKVFIERRAQRKGYPLKNIRKMRGQKDVFVVGIVSDIDTTRNGNVIVRIEDTEDEITLIIPKDKIDKILKDELLLDEVIGVKGMVSKSGTSIYVDEIIRPALPPKTIKKIDEEIYMAFLSDIHIGSKEFLHKEFGKFIRFLNGDVDNELEEKVVSRLKYICIAGDLVDGVGVYPGQEDDLYEVDIIEQYREIAMYLEQIPEHISIIISPGNHDAVRPAEPQPKLPEKITKLFNRDNIYFVGNPSTINIHGFDTLLYHGRSFDDLVGQIKNASYENPVTIMKELVKRRLLCPTYGGRCPIAPEHKDYLVIDRDIDILHTGHIHINGYGLYRGVVLVNSGTFQEQTDFQKRMGINPTPAIVPIINMSKVGEKGHYLEWDRGILEVRY
ncbi:DNA-directed DNA polymerase [Methanocaldococcus vulcanius M7]|uniref:DNA polymerase II small subunit n=1 Tax=Methanocaldococcus vulcanius (strain ATCC 700851 / DSM 12094 / M7) TaxID=579137 RepID=C9RG01_METVM|nr:DNA-directed DNA polymerase II small subunit [Methanocaldococcus vulcanius]ACX72503.1 DNA-directed DNA polymerase [Methanocaldococcus vulcanius M7]